ncbi:MAG: hypothetical protein RLZZ241_940 [Bacteroidota bacterium]|jgi:TonB-dependent SusC/RagA subfamily outer membrane receptor
MLNYFQKLQPFLVLMLFLGNLSAHGQVTALKPITLAWDTSRSMENNQPEYAFKYLDSIFKLEPGYAVRLLTFNSEVDSQNFEVRQGNWSILRNAINQLVYDGAAFYSALEKYLDESLTIIYTDGKQVLPQERLPVEKGHVVLSRATGNERKYLERAALLYRGKYVQLEPYPKDSQIARGLQTQTEGSTSGRIFVDNKPAAGLQVQTKTNLQPAITDNSGWFSIFAEPGDTLLISGGGFTLPVMRTLDAGPEPKIFLDSRVIALEEVELIKKISNETPAEVVDLGFGKTDKDRIGVGVQSIGDDRISSVTTDVSKAIQGKFSGVQLGQEDDISKVTMRTNNTMLLNNYGLIVVDGIPMQQGDSSGKNPKPAFNFVDPENIADITVLKGMAATTKYGTLGANGVILITTKNAIYGTGQTQTVDRARLRNNNYTGGDLTEGTASDLQQQISTVTAAQGYLNYQSLRNEHAENPIFYLEAFAALKQKDAALASNILTNLIESRPSSTGMLSTVLHGMFELGLNDAVLAIGEAWSELTPDMAAPLLYRAAVTNDKRSLNELVRKLILVKNGLDKSTEQGVAYADFLEKEIKHLVFTRRIDLDLNQLPEKYHSVPSYKTRLVFEWNTPGSEFAIQSVNPQQKFYTWEHSNAADPKIIQEELQSGVVFKDFELIGENSMGEWLFNVEFLDYGPEGPNLPFQIICKKYENFGTPQENCKVITMHFSQPGEKKTLLKFVVQ